MKPVKKFSKILKVYLTEKQHCTLKKSCKKNGLSMSGFLREIIEEYLK